MGHIVGSSFELQEVIGQGGMAEVWKARDEITGHTVAVKLMSAMVGSEVFEWRFRHEVRAMHITQRDAWLPPSPT